MSPVQIWVEPLSISIKSPPHFEGEYFVVLGKDFSLDGAPDPKVGLGNDGYKKETKLGELMRNEGRQAYRIPANLNPEDYNEVWIWCERFRVPLGVAKIS